MVTPESISLQIGGVEVSRALYTMQMDRQNQVEMHLDDWNTLTINGYRIWTEPVPTSYDTSGKNLAFGTNSPDVASNVQLTYITVWA